MKYWCSVILFLFPISSNYAQDSTKALPRELKHGIEFQIGSLLSLDNFDNYTFSYRYNFNNKSGIRVGIYTNINKDDNDIIQQADTVTYIPSIYSHNTNFRFSVQYLADIMSYNNFSLFWGAGPFIGYYKSESSSEYLSVNYINKSGSYTKTISFGLDVVLGVEYNLTNNVLLSGEYGLSISKENSDISNFQSYIYSNGSPDQNNKVSGEKHTFSTSGQGVKLGLSVFF